MPATLCRAWRRSGRLFWVEDLASGATRAIPLWAGAHRSIGRDVISAASPMGQALMGAAPGTVATIELPNGRSRTVRLVDVETGAPGWDDQERPPSQRERVTAHALLG